MSVPRILDTTGKNLLQQPPSGFYLCGACPVCGDPVFYHGGGQEEQHSAIANTQMVLIPEEFFPTCFCEIPAETPWIIPDTYTLSEERQAIQTLFLLWYGLRRKHTEAIAVLAEVYADNVHLEDETSKNDDNEHA